MLRSHSQAVFHDLLRTHFPSLAEAEIFRERHFAPDGAAILGPTPVAIQAGDFYFRPDALTVRPGTRAELAITNVSTEPHSFDLPALGVRLALPPGRTEAVAFAAPARAGTYYFWCQSPGQADAGMVGRLTVG